MDNKNEFVQPMIESYERDELAITALTFRVIGSGQD